MPLDHYLFCSILKHCLIFCSLSFKFIFSLAILLFFIVIYPLLLSCSHLCFHCVRFWTPFYFQDDLDYEVEVISQESADALEATLNEGRGVAEGLTDDEEVTVSTSIVSHVD